MKQNNSGRDSGQRAIQAAQDETPQAAPARSAREARADGGRAGVAGSAPSNTDPDNCNGDTFKALRWGVDSLYLSYSGELSDHSHSRLQALKKLAQSKEDFETAQAQYAVPGHVFEVKDKGTSVFPYILEDGAFRIQLSRPGKKVPMAYVKVSADLLAHASPQDVESELRTILEGLGQITGEAQVSRIDLFVDFVWSGNMEWSRECWVSRASNVSQYAQGDTFTGWSIGLGGIMSARLYFKLLELVKSGKDYLLDLWAKAGWDTGEHVWRLEFQIKREVLSQFGVLSLPQVLANLNGLWSYATDDWLRLALPSPEDKTRSRWPIHPLWGFLASVDWETSGGPLLRQFNPARLPKEERLLTMGWSFIVAYMAQQGISDFYQGQEAFMARLYTFLESKAFEDNIPFDDYVAERVGIKARQFNTLLNKSEEAWVEEESESFAKAYRKASKGN